ncbi:MAG: ATP-binding protein [Kiloniellaceae bacterium]
MATITGREHRPPSRMETTRAILARRRRNLLLPILLLVAVCLVAMAGLLYWSAGSLNDRDAGAQEDLVRSIVQMRRDTLRQLVIDYAWWDDAVAKLGTQMDERWAKEELPSYLLTNFDIVAGWVIAADGQTIFAFEDGRAVTPGVAPVLPSGIGTLISAARGATVIDQVPPASFVMHNQDLALVGASLIAPLHRAAGAGARNVLVFVQPLDLTLFNRAGVGEHIANLHFLRGAVPPGYVGCPVKGSEGTVIGSVVWRGQRSGDTLLWNVAPLLFVAFAAVCLLLFLAIKRVEMVVSREGRLSISLYQEKQRRSQKSSFVSMVSHELRTPLQAIGTSADMLERFGDQMSEAERREETRTIRRAVSTLARLVDDVLMMGRVEAGENSEGREPLDLGRFSRAVWREVSVALRARQHLVLNDRLDGPVCGAHDAALQTILSNLLQNAVKYSRGTGDIEVELARDGDSYLLAVTDCGTGIPEEQREAIFQPYWRAKEVDGIAGTGLGLSVARSAARSMGGDLTVEDGGPGKGARFVVRWPVSA